MPLAGRDSVSRAKAHMRWADRYERAGNAQKAGAHFGRALDYEKKSKHGSNYVSGSKSSSYRAGFGTGPRRLTVQEIVETIVTSSKEEPLFKNGLGGKDILWLTYNNDTLYVHFTDPSTGTTINAQRRLDSYSDDPVHKKIDLVADILDEMAVYLNLGVEHRVGLQRAVSRAYDTNRDDGFDGFIDKVEPAVNTEIARLNDNKLRINSTREASRKRYSDVRLDIDPIVHLNKMVNDALQSEGSMYTTRVDGQDILRHTLAVYVRDRGNHLSIRKIISEKGLIYSTTTMYRAFPGIFGELGGLAKKANDEGQMVRVFRAERRAYGLFLAKLETDGYNEIAILERENEDIFKLPDTQKAELEAQRRKEDEEVQESINRRMREVQERKNKQKQQKTGEDAV